MSAMICLQGTCQLYFNFNTTSTNPWLPLIRPFSRTRTSLTLSNYRRLTVRAQSATVAVQGSVFNGVNLVHRQVNYGDLIKWDTLHDFPVEDLKGKNVLLRIDLSLVLKDGHIEDDEPIVDVIPTISYLISNGARVFIASHWSIFEMSTDANLIADCFSHHLGKRVYVVDTLFYHFAKEKIGELSNGDVILLGNLASDKSEVSNDKEFARNLAKGIDILVNDAFSVSHRVLASTVGSTCFTCARLAGFQLEKELSYLTTVTSSPDRPYVAIVGGSRLSQLRSVLHRLLYKCSSIIVAGSMVFTFFNALGYSCPSRFIEKDMLPDVLKFPNTATTKKVDIILPVDFVCLKEGYGYKTFAAKNIPEGWYPVCLGEGTLSNIRDTLLPCKTAIWIGPLSVNTKVPDERSLEFVAKTFADITRDGCLTVVGGIEATLAVKRARLVDSISHISRGGAAFLEILKGVSLPGVAALDYACLAAPDWNQIYKNPELPLFIDIGSGNGLFILRMANDAKLPVNYLGLEVRKKLVDRCIKSVLEQRLLNVHYIQADAATMFKRIISTYPGKICFVAIQCPVPNFMDAECRRRMVQKQLVEQIIEILDRDGKIFLQSDVKSVAIQLKQDFLDYGNGRLGLSVEHGKESNCDPEGWLIHNPYGISTDWEDHVLERGGKMYRTLLSCY